MMSNEAAMNGNHPPAAGVSAAVAPGGLRRGDLLIVAVVLVLDQATKAVVRAWLALHESVNVVPGFVDLTHVRNTGAAFGIFNATDFPFKSIIMVGVAGVALLAIALYATRLPADERLARGGLALILGGAVGNLIDRATVGYVIDFVDAYWRHYHFWAFNVADAAITIGAIVLLTDMIRPRRPGTQT
jgi:signal peptidase II